MNGSIVGFTLNDTLNQVSGLFNQLQSGTYTASVQDILGCKRNVVITLPPATIPVIDDIILKKVSCVGKNDAAIQAVMLPASISCNYVLQPVNRVSGNGYFNNLSPGNYTLTATTNKNCADTMVINIPEPEPFDITFIETQDATCDRNNAKLWVETNKDTPLIYTLRPVTLINTDGIFTDLASGIYTITVRDSNFCTVDSVIDIGALPNLFTSTMQHTDLPCNGWGNEGTAKVIASGGVEPYTYLWDHDFAETNSQIDHLKYGWYFVQVTDATGCSLKDTVFVKPGPCCENIFIPNAFTPNGDFENDTWRLVTTAGLEIEQFAVYNRWGERVWHTWQQQDEWDGKRNGADVSTGTYFYLLKYKCLSDGKMYLKKGDVTVLR
jgi:gliding motility-associated-like protein